MQVECIFFLSLVANLELCRAAPMVSRMKNKELEMGVTWNF